MVLLFGAFNSFILKGIQWAGHIVRMDDPHISNSVMGECSGGRRPMEKPRGRLEEAVRKDAVDYLQIQNWKASARNKEICKQKIGESMTSKHVEAPRLSFCSAF
jgi:hypothetical protein